MDANGLPDDLRSRVLLATHEAAADAVEDGDSADHVEVSAAIGDDGVSVEVTHVTSGRAIEPLEHERVRSRGLILVQLLMAQVDMQASATGLTVRMSQPIRRGAHASSPPH